MARRAQVSIEYLMVTAFAFMLTIPIVILFYSQSQEVNEEVTASQVDRIATEIVDAANEVYYLGEPSKKTMTIYMPERVQNVKLEGPNLIFEVSSTSGQYEVVRVAATNLTGSIEAFSGIHNIEVEAQFQEVKITG